MWEKLLNADVAFEDDDNHGHHDVTMLEPGVAGAPSGSCGPKHFVLQEGFAEQETKRWPFKMSGPLKVMVSNSKQNAIKSLILNIFCLFNHNRAAVLL